MSSDWGYYGLAFGFALDAALIIYICHRRGMTLSRLTDTVFDTVAAIYRALRKCAGR